VVDVVRYDTMFVQDRLGPFGDSIPSLWRWTIDPVGGAVKEEQLDDRPVEFPRIGDERTGRRHRFGYAAGIGSDSPDAGFGALIKYDLATGRSELHDVGAGRGAGEGVFVPRPGARAEDDGWVFSIVYDPDRDASDILVVAADDFAAPPVATVHLPVRVPFGFHGSWVPDTALSG
jgi:carotenoid cleavage oxygenase